MIQCRLSDLVLSSYQMGVIRRRSGIELRNLLTSSDESHCEINPVKKLKYMPKVACELSLHSNMKTSSTVTLYIKLGNY